MARAKLELRPCGIASGPMTALAASRGKTCFDSTYPVTYTFDTFKRNFLAASHGCRRHG